MRLYRKLTRAIPNLLSFFRIAVTPVIVWALFTGRYQTAFWWFFFAGWTDALDGYTARRFGLTSRTGAYLDPIADKTLLTGVFIAYGLSGLLPAWLIWLIVGRDILILLGAITVRMVKGLTEFPPSKWGKISTVFQILLAVVTAAAHAFPDLPLSGVGRLLIWVSAVATALSGAHYLWRGIDMLRTPPSVQSTV
jgi:cardiolipin synthase (CMP-forming)